MFPGLFSQNLSGGDPNYVIFWNFRSDVDKVTVVKGSDKTTMALAEARSKPPKTIPPQTLASKGMWWSR